MRLSVPRVIMPTGNGLTNPRRKLHQNPQNAEEVSILLRVNALTLICPTGTIQTAVWRVWSWLSPAGET